MAAKSTRLISWNVNGIRSAIRKGFWNIFDSQPTIVCVQETKAEQQQVPIEVEGYQDFWNSAHVRGYSGTCVFSKVTPQSVSYGIGKKQHDTEGRVITLEFAPFYLVNVYVPNSKRGLLRHEYRIQQWNPDFLKYLKKLEKHKPVVVCGDFNVAHREIDIANPKSNQKNAGFTPEERQGMDQLQDQGFIDTFRVFNQEPHQYTWWSVRNDVRARNIGWRIDYFLASAQLSPQLKQSRIHSQIMGSDHCPIELELGWSEKEISSPL